MIDCELLGCDQRRSVDGLIHVKIKFLGRELRGFACSQECADLLRAAWRGWDKTLQLDHDTPKSGYRPAGGWAVWGVTAVVGFMGGFMMLGVGYGLGLLDGATGRPLPEGLRDLVDDLAPADE